MVPHEGIESTKLLPARAQLFGRVASKPTDVSPNY